MNSFDSLDLLIITLLTGTPLALTYYLYAHIRDAYRGKSERVSEEKYAVNVFRKGEG